jgi:hypothetical protein
MEMPRINDSLEICDWFVTPAAGPLLKAGHESNALFLTLHELDSC